MTSHALRSQSHLKKTDDANTTNGNQPPTVSNVNNKRNADESPDKVLNNKRSAFGDLTNAGLAKKALLQAKKADKKGPITRKTRNETLNNKKQIANIKKEADQTLKSSQESLNAESEFYSASESSILQDKVSPSNKLIKTEIIFPPGVDDFDKSTLSDPFAEPHYAREIFDYYKERENKFQIVDYMDRQPELSKGMRAILIDWLVEVQESFELNHETLYLAVKLIDHYLMKVKVTKASLQLLGATAIFVACKFDERCPPLIDDFLYICDDAYTRRELITMERQIVKTLNFDLGIPLSYRFLRRYARCAKVSMEVLTLARFILETSLMEYDMILKRDSKIAAAALQLALMMKKMPEWTPTLEYYSGYKAEELCRLVFSLNKMIASPQLKTLQTIRTKYSHKVFFEVAKIPTLSKKTEA